MAERKKPISIARDDTSDHRAKRPRLIESDSGPQQPLPANPTTISTLSALLDFSSLSSHADVHQRFGQLARTLLHDHLLVVTAQPASADPRQCKYEYEFLEVEFYLRAEGTHEDPFTHGAREQRTSGRWYFHRAPQKSSDPSKSATSASGYRGGTRKGLDLTIGGPVLSAHFAGDEQADGTRGGILLRTIRRLSDGAVISGPSLLVDELLRVCGAVSIAELVGEKLAGDTSAFCSPQKMCSISLVPRIPALGRKPIVYCSPRIGLDLSHPGTSPCPADPRILFIQKAYRYFTNPMLLTANGRAQTFLGIYELLSEAEILNEEGVLDEVARLSGIKCVGKYASDYKQGKERGEIERFVGTAGKGASSSPSSYLKMMGTLKRLGARLESPKT